MGFGLKKCAKASFKRGKLASSGNLAIDEDTAIQELNQEEVYKYLGVDESDERLLVAAQDHAINTRNYQK
ncbi:unnamed protein product [Pocillopora meandrina]|uniref:Uncharacterized protein n=1 Tax=Pocillopora meandrina TaxID=46732 RepID=A0AAU9Y3R4_9CNID|nr:unnamed protein product [Pocillopora meandrina]